MKKFTLLLALGFFIVSASFAQTTTGCSTIFISEYLDGINNNKAIEIFNPTNAAKSLTGCSILIFPLGSLVPINIPLQGSIAAKGTFVLTNPLASSAILSKANQTNVNLLFSGRNAVVLQIQNVDIDKIGEIGVTPNILGWSVPPNGSTVNHDLRRKHAITAGNTVWSNCKNEWDIFPNDSIYNLGSHSSVCDTVALPLVIVQQPDTISWYRYGKLLTFIHQKDVYSFNYKPNTQPTSIHDSSIASMIETTNDGVISRILNVLLKPSLTIAQLQQIRQTIEADPAFEKELMSVTQPAMMDNSATKWFSLDDRVTVVFKDVNISSTQVSAFASKYNVLVTMTPPTDKPAGTHGIYMFKLRPVTDTTSHLLAKAMWEGDSIIIQAVEPNILNFAQPNAIINCPINDTYFNDDAQCRLWHIKNNGTLRNSNGSQLSTNGADPDICGCWSAGYTGAGIKIAVMDGDGFEWTHEDLNGQFIDGWDCTRGPVGRGQAYTSSTPLPAYVSGKYHGTSVSSTASAAVNNDTGIAGVAPDAKIIPLLINYFDGDGSTFNIAFNKILSLNPDIVNFSFGFTQDYSPWHDLIRLDWIPNGRNGKGIVCVAAAGNKNGDSIQFPAAWNEVIGVIGTNPNDFRHSGGDGWGGVGSVGSSYGFWYDVAAPGARITTASFMGRGDPVLGSNYKIEGGTSFSSPIVAGIAAMVLEKNPTFTQQQVFNAITSTADKVYPYTYGHYNENADYPGKSKEMGHGRVNCFNAINGIVGINEVAEKAGTIKIVSPATDNLTVLYYLNPNIKKVRAKIYDIVGQSITEITLPSENNAASINISHISNGIYVIAFYAEDGRLIQSNKFIK